MTDSAFDYQVVLKSDLSGAVSSLIAYQVRPDSPFRAVIWSVPRHSWVYAPALAVSFLYDDKYRDRIQPVDRHVAEQAALLALRSELPNEAVLLEMCAEGERMGWDYGPPRQADQTR
ncbi:hypothetical protein [Actinoplanes sp. NPDC051494]|uniref:hypothetical protein n=1 Tax=Actinoplanes sp. NPDC051494 TaxID=3363907 RepID=UPI00379417B0